MPPADMAIELHDSWVAGVRAEGSEVVVAMSVYLLITEAGRRSGWEQDAELRLPDGAVEAAPPATGLWILDGSIIVDAERFDNWIPLPFDRAGSVRVSLVGGDGRFSARATRATVVLKGQARYVEDTPP